jgi:tetratricopeptide (TPR) repeat protein
MRRPTPIPLAAALLIAAGGDAAPVPAKVHFKNNRVMEVQLVRRDGDLLMVREAGKPAEIGFRASEIVMVEFPLDLEKRNVGQLFGEEKFGETAAALKPLLEPTHPYLDLPNNALATVRWMARCLHWAGQHEELLRTSAALRPFLKDASAQREMLCLEAAAQMGLGRTNEVAATLAKLEPVTRKDEQAALYWLTLAELQISRGQWTAAHETAAKVVAFRARDLEWLAPGLMLTARCYAHAQQYEAAEGILKEMQVVFPRSRWAKRAAEVAATVAQQHAAYKAEQQKKIAEEAKAKAVSATVGAP